MKVDLRLDENNNLIYQTIHGSCSLESLEKVFDEMERLNIKPGLKIFSDITDANLSAANYNSISLLERRLDGFIDCYLPVRKAIYVETLLEFGIARMYQMLAEKDGFDVHVFKEKELAFEWLNNPLLS